MLKKAAARCDSTSLGPQDYFGWLRASRSDITHQAPVQFNLAQS